MAAMSGHGTQQLQSPASFSPKEPYVDELRQAKREIELLKTMDPFRAADMAIEIQVERMRVAEATNARDTVAQRLADAYISVRQKNAAIEALRRDKAILKKDLALFKPGVAVGEDTINDAESESEKEVDEEIVRLEGVVMSLGDEVKLLKENAADRGHHAADPPPRYEQLKADAIQDDFNHEPLHPNTQLLRTDASRIPFRVLSDNHDIPQNSIPSPQLDDKSSTKPQQPQRTATGDSNDFDHKIIHTPSESEDPDYMLKARHAILASLPLSPDIPDDALKPILIPAPFTLHEFLGNASGSLRSSLSNYRVFQQLTTSWCPDREEHGYMVTPVFKCSTNPRVATAHRWSAVDVIGKMNRPTECFYNKDGKWYYAGIYQAFRLEDLTTKEWETLSNETSQALVKETISGRKNTSPQNLYETSQLYAAGALKVACVGLQCVGFNNPMYRAILEQAKKCEISGKWRSGDIAPAPTLGWTASANLNTDQGAGEVVGASEGAWKSPDGIMKFPSGVASAPKG